MILDRCTVGSFGCALLLWSTTQCGGNAASRGAVGASQGGDAASGDADSSPSVVCPANEPMEGQPCPVAVPPACWYGDSPRPECRDVWLCPSGAWHASHQGCAPLPSGFCPAPQPSPGASCAVSDPSESGANCAYSDGTLCTCQCSTYSGRGAGSGNGCVPNIFSCRPPATTPGCPPTVPNLGFPCGVQGTQCIYGNPCVGGVAMFCRSGLWSIDPYYACYD